MRTDRKSLLGCERTGHASVRTTQSSTLNQNVPCEGCAGGSARPLLDCTAGGRLGEAADERKPLCNFRAGVVARTQVVELPRGRRRSWAMDWARMTATVSIRRTSRL